MAIDYSKFLPKTTTATPIKSGIDFSKFLPVKSATTTPTTAQTTKVSKIQDFLGGGAYTTKIGSPNEIVTTKKSQKEIENIKPGYDRHHIVPWEQGGVSTKENLKSIPAEENQELAQVQARAMKDYEVGKISLAKARFDVITKGQTQEAEKEGVTTSVWKNFYKEMIAIPKAIVEMYTKPSENIKKTEEILGVGSSKGIKGKILPPPVKFVGKAFIRTVAPGLEGFATDIGELIAFREISKKVATGELPKEALDELEVLGKTNAQIIGDTTMAVLTAYMPNLIKQSLVKGANQTIISAAIQAVKNNAIPNAVFSAANIASSGTTDKQEMVKIGASTMLAGSIFAGAIGAIGSVIGKVIKPGKKELNPIVAQDVIKDTTLQVNRQLNNPKFSQALQNINTSKISSWGDLFVKMAEAVEYNPTALQTLNNHLQTRWKFYRAEPKITTQAIGPEFQSSAISITDIFRPRLTGKVIAEPTNTVKNTFDPTIEIKVKEKLGVDANGEKIKAKTVIDGDKTTIMIDESVKSPRKIAEVLDHETRLIAKKRTEKPKTDTIELKPIDIHNSTDRTLIEEGVAKVKSKEVDVNKIEIEPTSTNKFVERQKQIVASLSEQETKSYLDYKKKTVSAFQEFKTVFDNIRKKYDVDIWAPNTKSDLRTIEKAVDDYGGDFNKVKDSNRGAFIVKNFSDATKILKDIKDNYKVTKIDNRYESTSFGYRDININIEMSNGTKAEIQIMTPEIQKTKGIVHALYEKIRVIKSASKIRSLTEVEKIQKIKLENEMATKYERAWAYDKNLGFEKARYGLMLESKKVGINFKGISKFARDNGGITVDFEGKTKDKGYAFSVLDKADELVLTIDKNFDRIFIAQFKKLKAKYGDNPANNMGGWVQDGKFVIDVSNVSTNLKQSLYDAIIKKQDAIGDLGKYAKQKDGTIYISKGIIDSLEPIARGSFEKGKSVFKDWGEAVKYYTEKNFKNSQEINSEVLSNIKPAGVKAGFNIDKKLKGSLGLSAEDVMKKYPDINLKRDVKITDIHGQKDTIPAGEALTPYELKGNKVLLQDGETYIVSKNQFQNIKGQSVSGEAKEFAPELKGTEESILGYKGEMPKAGDPIIGKNVIGSRPPKFSQYQLPGGENYREVLIKAPVAEPTNVKIVKQENGKYEIEVNGEGMMSNLTKAKAKKYAPSYGDIQKDQASFKSSHWDEPNVISHLRINDRTYKGKKVAFMEELQSDWAREGRSKGFATEITKDTAKQQGFTVNKTKSNLGSEAYFIENFADEFFHRKGFTNTGFDTEVQAWDSIIKKLKKTSGAVPSHPLLKNWQEPTIKRALKDAVDNGAEYFSWINGEQTSARYNLSQTVENVKWGKSDVGDNFKSVVLQPKGDSKIALNFDKKTGIINYGKTDWQGKKLDEVLGKGLADKIMAQESGTLSGEGLKFGGEWANTLYDKQVGNIVKDLTGADVIKIDMGLPVNVKSVGADATDSWGIYTKQKSGSNLWSLKTVDDANMKIGLDIVNKANGQRYTITDILGDGKFKAVPKKEFEGYAVVDPLNGNHIYNGNNLANAKAAVARAKERGVTLKLRKLTKEDFEETFDISVKKSAGQQAIKITPEIKALVKGEAPKLKSASGKDIFAEPPEPPTPPKAAKPLDNKALESSVWRRMKEEFPEEMRDTITYDRAVIKERMTKSIKLIESNPKKAFLRAMGYDKSSAPDSAMTNITLSTKALQNQDWELAANLIKNRTLAQTERGQAIAMEKGSVLSNSVSSYIRRALSQRLENLSQETLGKLDITKLKSKKTNAVEIIKTKADKMTRFVEARRLDIKEAQNLIDSLIC